ncbi:MAG: hypothetical protein ABI162_16900 [Luteolibacter sp.]
MKKSTLILMLAVSLAAVCHGQEPDEVQKFNDAWDKSLARAEMSFPDLRMAESALYKRVSEIDATLKEASDPLYNSVDKPWEIACRAAKELGISPLPPAVPDTPLPATKSMVGENFAEFCGYRSVTVRSVEPDGIRIIHESGAVKIPIENLSAEERAKFGLTPGGAEQYRKNVADRSATAEASRHVTEPSDSGRSAKKEPARPVVITADQVKIAWVKRLAQPRALDPDYGKKVATYRDFITDIRAGNRDLDAQETAATYNRARFIQAGDLESAKIFEAELSRISEAKTAAEALAAQKAQGRKQRSDFLQLNNELMSIDRNLRNIDSTIRGW